MNSKTGASRRAILQVLSTAVSAPALARAAAGAQASATPSDAVAYPRRYTGPQLNLIAFPLGGVGAGSVSLGGRGQLRDWEIFNKPDKGFVPNHAYPVIWAKVGNKQPFACILESQIEPPYQGGSGLGSNNLPGMMRLQSATFTGEYPLASVRFADARLPVEAQLEAFSPFIPLDLNESGLPAAILRYRVRNRGSASASVSIGWALDNMLGAGGRAVHLNNETPQKTNEIRNGKGVRGLMMTNPGLPTDDPMQGSIAFATLDDGGRFSAMRGWPAERWWASPMLFWDDFSADGELGPEPDRRNSVGSFCLKREIAAGAEAAFTFVLAWHFPNRTPARCGWTAPKGKENDVIGNWYCTRFKDAWAAAEYAAANLPRLEAATMEFVNAMRESTLPGAVKDAATANLSTLASTTCFRTADGEFHGFEGVNDKLGCCFGNCTHVWNYEVATDYLFPSIARSFRNASFTDCLDDYGAIHFRQLLPRGIGRSGFAAADGQMGQLVKSYLDWKLSRDDKWIRDLWPRVKKSVEFCWIAGGWDADRDGVMEGPQHNTYDVEFFGPNPQCGIYYLAGLRAAEEMAKAAGDAAFATTCAHIRERGRQWIDANLFNGQFYVQKVRGIAKDKIGPALMSDMGSDDTLNPSFQVGEGCLVDQLMGQYLADLSGLGDVVDSGHIQRAMRAIWTNNLRRDLRNHEGFQRTYALNDESALIICDYKQGARPRIPFPYYAEAWTGLEYMAASLMMHHGMVAEGIATYEYVRKRFDGVKRNPWDEAECGHHYARAMSAWSGVHALAGFDYDGAARTVRIAPRRNARGFASIWAAGAAWGMLRGGPLFSVEVRGGELGVQRLVLPGVSASKASVVLNGAAASAKTSRQNGLLIELDREVTLHKGDKLELRS